MTAMIHPLILAILALVVGVFIYRTAAMRSETPTQVRMFRLGGVIFLGFGLYTVVRYVFGF